MIIDSHCHLHDEKFKDDLDEVLNRAKLTGVTHLITIGCDIKTSTSAKLLADKLDHIYFTAGFHPHEAKFLDQNSLKELKELAKHKKCVAIGECGLDYYYLHSTADEQRKAFTKQVEVACELNLPLVIHLRDAFDDCIAILKNAKLKKPAVLHCFSGTVFLAKIFLDLGCYISMSGIITFKKPGELPLVAREAPLERLLVETDCPYLAPHPYRGQRNEPSYIVETIGAIANARGENIDFVRQQLYKNTIRFFSLPQS